MNEHAHGPRRTREDAIALPMALALALVAAVIILAVMMSAMGASDRSRSSVNEALGRTPADQGAASYLRALNARAVGEFNDFHFPDTAQSRALLPEGTTVVANRSLPGELGRVDTSALTGVPADSRNTYVRETSPGVFTYWQLFSLVRPDWRAPGGRPTSGAKVVAYFRGWIANKANSTTPETVITRVEFRPQRFGDYQLIVDGQINFEPGASVRGPVHSNGFPDRMFGTLTPGDPVIKGSIACSGAARFSSSSGRIAVTGGSCGAQLQRENVRETINVRALEAEATFHWNLCRGGRYLSPERRFQVRCLTPPAGRAMNIDLRTVGGAPSTLVVVDGDANVRGTVPAGQRVTVLAYDVEVPGVPDSTTGASIHVTGNASHAADGMLGLFAGDDVFVEDTVGNPCAVTRIDGAVIATTGTLSMPSTWRVPLMPTTAVPLCGSTFVSYGSIASHYTPFLALTSGPTVLLGYRRRTYSFDPNMRYTPPPGMPLAQQWQKYGYDEANKACFDTSTYTLRSMECA
jgi:hypothetical protein